MGTPVRWGILGASKFALEQMGPAIHRARGAELAGLATSSAEKAAPFASFAPGLRVFESYDALLADPNIDAVYIPLPNHLHVEWVLKCLDHGKPVLCEKPIALKADEIDPLIAARDAAGLMTSEAYMIVHHPQWQRARDLIADGAIGTLRHVTGAFSYNNPDMSNIRNRPDTGGGSLPDIGVYTIGGTRFATGQNHCEILQAEIDWEAGVEVTARATAQFEGFTADWMTSMRLHPQQEMTFHGDGGLVRLTAPFNPQVFGQAQVELRRTGHGDMIERFPADSHYVNQVEAFGAAMGGADWPWPLEQAQHSQRIIDAIYEKANPAL